MKHPEKVINPYNTIKRIDWLKGLSSKEMSFALQCMIIDTCEEGLATVEEIQKWLEEKYG